MATVAVKVPNVGDFDAVEIIEVLVAVGDVVALEQPLITLESDKATMEVPSDAAGTVKALKVKVGDKLREGDVILLLEAAAAVADSAAGTETVQEPPEAAATPAAPTAQSAQDVAPVATEPARPQSAEADLLIPATAAPVATHSSVHASPSVRKFARELGADLARINGSGPKGRITREDVQAFVKQALTAGAGASAGAGLPQMPDVDFAKFGEVETVALPRIRKLSARNLHRNWLVVPHVTQFDAADITELEAFRKEQKAEADRRGVKLTMLAFMLKACANTLIKFPELNSSLAPDGESLIVKKYINIGVAADTDNGLVVPVIRAVDEKGIYQLAAEVAQAAAKARDGKLSPADMQGGCFSISSLGGIGGTAFTPIVNAPEVAILGVSRSSMQPVWDGKAFQPRLMLPLSLSYDHRVIDGAQAARITGYLAGLLSDIRRALL